MWPMWLPTAPPTSPARFVGYSSLPKKVGAQTAEANISSASIAAARQVVAYLRDGIDRFASASIQYTVEISSI